MAGTLRCLSGYLERIAVPSLYVDHGQMRVLKSNPWLTGIAAGFAFGLLMGVFFGLSTTPFADGFNKGLLAGVFFGVVMSLIALARSGRHTPPADIAAEEIIVCGPANHF